MKKLLWANKILVGIILLSMIVATIVLVGRVNIEKQAKSYDMIMDFTEVSQMADQSDNNVSWWLDQFKQMGINKVGLSEESLLSLTDVRDIPVSAKMMHEIMKNANWKSAYPVAFIKAIEKKGYDEYDVVVEARSAEYFKFISNAITERFSSEKYVISADANGGYILLNGNSKDALYSQKFKKLNSIAIGFTESDEIISSKILYVSLGLMPSKVNLIESKGLEIIPRSSGYKGWNDLRYAKAVVAGYSKLKKVPEYALFSGEETLGFGDPKGAEYMASVLNKNGTIVGLIENTTQLQNMMQDGLDKIIVGVNGNVTRTFTVWDYIQNRYQYYGYSGSEEIENTLFRAIVERNIRLVYFKPMKEFKDNHTYVTDVNEYKTLISGLNARLLEHNITPGKASVMGSNDVKLIYKLLLGFGCAAAGIFLLITIIPVKRKIEYGLLGLALIGVSGLLFMDQGLTTLITSFSFAVVFPCLAMIFMLKQSKEYSDKLSKDAEIGTVITKSIIVLVSSTFIVLIGGLMTAAPISDISYMLEMNAFRGVKLSQLLPIAFFAVAYLAYFGFGRLKRIQGKLEMVDLKDMMNSSIKIWMVVIGLIGGAVGAYYIMRTGHDSELVPSNFEMLMRNTLEAALVARPRTKEFLFAFPAIMLLVYTSIRQFKIWPMVFGVASVIGLTSVVNTFMHIRTPLYLGIARTGYSLLIGLAVGLIGILVFEGIYTLYKKLNGKSFLNE